MSKAVNLIVSVVFAANGIVDVKATVAKAEESASAMKAEQEKDNAGLSAQYGDTVESILLDRSEPVPMAELVHATLTQMNVHSTEYAVVQKHKANVEKYVKFNVGTLFFIKRGPGGGVILLAKD